MLSHTDAPYVLLFSPIKPCIYLQQNTTNWTNRTRILPTHHTKCAQRFQCFPFGVGKLEMPTGNACPVCAQWVPLFDLFETFRVFGGVQKFAMDWLKHLFLYCNYETFHRKHAWSFYLLIHICKSYFWKWWNPSWSGSCFPVVLDFGQWEINGLLIALN